jgi:hypothetical protein
MAGSPGDQGAPDPTVPDPAWSWPPPPTAVPPTVVPPTTVPPSPPAAAVTPTHPPTQPSPPGGQAAAFTATETVSGSPQDGSRWENKAQPAAWRQASSGRPQEIVRHGPGVPAIAPDSQAGPAAEEVWRTGLPGESPRRQKSLYRRAAGPVLTVILLVAAIVVIYVRLHQAPFGVTGVAITGQVRSGCAVDVTGRIGTSGGAGTVSYEWTFQPQLETPQPISQSVAAGQSAVYVTAAVEGQGQGTLAQTATLRVLGPGQGSASAHIVISC